ncbi:hypothetical protein DLE60_01810 [Micromonospora globispora]|uniref:Uncharacterized protein n=1 Tax=Micromonospora globispora TaxID=1450148 RepID=A0A317KED7_9ACTN|nr:hypothetical protein [Micromonospora globispora]PWU51960.1 hypothetical protein DLJ46_03905 [Micromonospora globispora]PWU62150.1 hypothetical protein DLE60_01810 [Micromonospora globispora]
MSGIKFYWTETGRSEYRATDERLSCLGMWLVGDVQADRSTCLDLLADLEDITAGRKEHESWEGNAWAAELSPTGVDLQNLWREELSAHYTLAETRGVAERYWRLLAEDPGRGAAVQRWEERNGRRHPYQGL